MTIVVRREDIDTIVEHCRGGYPLETCGILLGEADLGIRRVSIVFPTENILQSEREYQINPQEQLEAFMKADELSLEVVGYYHSHPYWHAHPSATDIERANQPNCSYIIYSNVDNEVRSFEWDGKEFRPEELIIREE
ncbi:MAG: M67 family metallopeptidase [Candidatus Bathyarchaeia archaeon]